MIAFTCGPTGPRFAVGDTPVPVEVRRVVSAALVSVLCAGTANADGYFFTGYEYQLFALNSGDPSHEYFQLYGDQTTVDGVTRRSFDTGRRISASPPWLCSDPAEPPVFAPIGFARAAGAMDLASGSMALLSVTGGAGAYSHTGAMLEDTLTFQLPDGMTQAEVTATLTINGTYTSPTTGGHHVSGYVRLYLAGMTADNGGDFPADTFVGHIFSVTTTVQDGSAYFIQAWLLASLDGVVDWCAGEIGSYNLSAFVDVETPAGVTYRAAGSMLSSASNVFLTAEDADSDGTSDLTDNCTLAGNISQFDADGDGIGNRCDADLDNDCLINFRDLAIMKDLFFSNNALADLSTDGIVNFADLSLMKSAFFGSPGPSSQLNVCSNQQ